jgi:hypothetical protein
MAVVTLEAQMGGSPAGGFFQVDGKPINTSLPKESSIGFCIASSKKYVEGASTNFFSVQLWYGT